MAFKTFTSGAVLTAAEVNTYLMQQAVVVCTAATRPSAPVEGMRIFETDTDLNYEYNGSAWVLFGALGAWIAYTPTVAGWAIGNGTVTSSYQKIGRMVTFSGSIVAGSTTTFAAALTVSLPFNPSTGWWVGTNGIATDVSANAHYPCMCRVSTGTNVLQPYAVNAAGTYAAIDVNGLLDPTAPFDWTTSDEFWWDITYQAAS